MTEPNGQYFVQKLLELGRLVRGAVLSARDKNVSLAGVHKLTTADTIYQIDTHVEPVIEQFCERWSQEVPLVLIAEGIGPEGQEGHAVFPAGTPENAARIRVIIDPIDGTRELMYDKRSAWFLAGVAPNKGAATRLSDIFAAAQVELPVSKQAASDVLWSVKGQGAHGQRETFHGTNYQKSHDLTLRPSQADNIDHGFASLVNFFPGAKILTSRLMEKIIHACLGPPDVSRPITFEDQYLSTGGQLYELLVGHYRFLGDLRHAIFQLMKKPGGMCVHPYDLAASLIASEAGVWLSDGLGGPLDGPLDVNTNLQWAGFANATLRNRIEPVIIRTLKEWQAQQPAQEDI